MKIVYIGAGSRDFGKGQIIDLAQSGELKGRKVTISLVDINEQALDTMTKFAQKVFEHYGMDFQVESGTERKKALADADYVITSVARNRWELWEQDYRVPLSYGFKHCLGENGGPGALFHALRSYELIIPLCRDIEKICPEAILLNFTNPEARVLHAVSTLTKVKAYGICHGVFDALRNIKQLLKKPLEELEIVSAGLNHFYVVLKIRDRKTGEDLLPMALKKAKEKEGNDNPLFRRMLDLFDMFTYSSDDHIGEYLSCGSEFHGPKWIYGREVRPVKLQKKVSDKPKLEDYASGKAKLDDSILKPSGEDTVPMICDMELGRKSERPAVNVLNSKGYIENLATTGVVEVPAIVEGGQILPQKVGCIPEPIAAMIRTHHTIISLITEAYRTRSRKLLLQALVLDPNVNSIVKAEKMLDDMLELQKEFIPSFQEKSGENVSAG